MATGAVYGWSSAETRAGRSANGQRRSSLSCKTNIYTRRRRLAVTTSALAVINKTILAYTDEKARQQPILQQQQRRPRQPLRESHHRLVTLSDHHTSLKNFTRITAYAHNNAVEWRTVLKFDYRLPFCRTTHDTCNRCIL